MPLQEAPAQQKAYDPRTWWWSIVEKILDRKGEISLINWYDVSYVVVEKMGKKIGTAS